MRKFLISIVCCICLCFSFMVGGIIPKEKAYAQNNEENFLISEIETELKEFLQFGSEEKNRLDRTAGSAGEKEAGNYILASLKQQSGLEPINNGYFKDGVQNFDVVSYDGATLSSQNIGFIYKSKISGVKTITFATHYDNLNIYKLATDINGNISYVPVAIEGVNESAGAVAMLIAFAKYIAESNMQFNFNIEFVFFGSSNQNYAGASAYLRSINSVKDNYALIINFDNITIGDYNYIYSQEFECDYSNYLNDNLIGKFNFTNFSRVNNITTTDNGYTHAGLQSDSSVFIESGINVANIFSGNYNGFSSLGLTESLNHSIITNTELDTIEGIENEYGINVATNLSRIASSMIDLITKEDFIEKVSVSAKLNGKYNFWQDKKLALFIFSIITVIIFIVYYAIYWWLYKRSKKQMSNEQLASVVMKIQTEHGEITPDIKEDKIEE